MMEKIIERSTYPSIPANTFSPVNEYFFVIAVFRSIFTLEYLLFADQAGRIVKISLNVNTGGDDG